MTVPHEREPGADSALASAAATPSPSRAGRGGLLLAGAKLAFVVVGFVQQLLLPRVVGAAGYGDVSRVLAIVGIVNNVMIAASLQGVSRTVASATDARTAQGALRRLLGMHLLVAIVAAALFALLATPIANGVSAPQLALPLAVSSVVVLAYGVYGALVGALNGAQRFGEQAGLDVAYGFVRTAGLLGGGALLLATGSSGVLGAVGGFAAAAVLIVPVAAWRTGLGTPGATEPTARAYAGFLGPLALGQALLNLLLQADFLVLSRYAGQAANAGGLPPEAASELAGAYRGALLFAFLPYQLLLSVTFVLFPMLARARAEGERARVGELTARGLRIGLVLTGLLSGVTSGLAPHVLRLAFPESIATPAAAPLRLLALGMGGLAMLGIACAALTSLGRERVVVAINALAVALVVGAASTLVPRAPFGPSMLVASATGTTVGLGVAAALALLAVRATASRGLPLLTLVRVGGAVALVVWLGSHAPWLGKLGTLALAAGLGLAYLVLLVATGELGRAERALAASVLRRGGSA